MIALVASILLGGPLITGLSLVGVKGTDHAWRKPSGLSSSPFKLRSRVRLARRAGPRNELGRALKGWFFSNLMNRTRRPRFSAERKKEKAKKENTNRRSHVAVQFLPAAAATDDDDAKRRENVWNLVWKERKQRPNTRRQNYLILLCAKLNTRFGILYTIRKEKISICKIVVKIESREKLFNVSKEMLEFL